MNKRLYVPQSIALEILREKLSNENNKKELRYVESTVNESINLFVNGIILTDSRCKSYLAKLLKKDLIDRVSQSALQELHKNYLKNFITALFRYNIQWLENDI